MKTKKKIKLLIIVLLAIVFSPVILFALLHFLSMSLLFGAFMIGHITAPVPDVPEIRYGEFPYEVVYRTDGEIHTVSGIYVCEYAGIDSTPSSMGQTKVLNWKSYVKNTNVKFTRTNKYIPLLSNDNLEVYLEINDPGYYMGQKDIEPIDKPTLVCYTISESIVEIPERAGEKFKKVCDVEIISYKLPTPIENTFVQKKWYEFWK